jgi:hypothetical protein
VNAMTIPKIIRDTIRYLLKASRKVFFRNLLTMLYIDKCYAKIDHSG